MVIQGEYPGVGLERAPVEGATSLVPRGEESEDPLPPTAARREYRLRRHHPPCAGEGSRRGVSRAYPPLPKPPKRQNPSPRESSQPRSLHFARTLASVGMTGKLAGLLSRTG